MNFFADWSVIDTAVDWLARGVLDLNGWQMVLVTLGLTHVTMITPLPRIFSASGCG
jgi:stearoyl-CoA desaturase (delta-9 desaturase)